MGRRAVIGIFGLAWAVAARCPDAIELAQPQGGLPASARAVTEPSEGVWLTRGGEASFGFNPDALAALHIRIASARGASERTPGAAGQRRDTATFAALDAGVLQVLHRGESISGVGDGELRFNGGFVFDYPGGSVDLRGFALRSDPAVRLGLVVVDAHGQTWFTADHAHYGFDPNLPHTFSMSNMNLRLSAHFAEAIGRPESAGIPIGDLQFRTLARRRETAATLERAVCNAPWPGSGLTTDIQLIYSNISGFYDSIYAARCGLPPLPSAGACTATSTNGKLVLGSDASLRNAGETGVAWHSHFSGSYPPYNNDQHPYLIWNLYRVDSGSRIKHIGASGVKHAFYSVNENCGCAGGNVIWPNCEDVYSFSSNDNGGGGATQNLAPRSEIIPYRSVWARCGSVWDANCDGVMDAGSGAHDLYQYRMLVDESDMLPPLSTGAHYFFEYWYLVRDDVNIYNTMGYREILPQKSGASWNISLVNGNAADHDFFPGPAINRWVDPAAASADAANRELITARGRARVAVKATAQGSGQWRYEYAVMNFDYAHIRTDPAHPDEPNLKLLSNHGFSSFSVPLPAGANAIALRFDDADGDGNNDWQGTVTAGAVSWTSSAAGNTLDWGTLYHFEFTSNSAPAATTLTLIGAATASEGQLSYTLALLGPRAVDNDTIFKNGFD